MNKEQGKKGIFERGAAFYEKLNYGLGAAAIAGSLIAPPEVAPFLVAFGALQFAEGALIRWIRKGGARKALGMKPKPSPA